ncbi:MAG: DNA recombination protein RmuC [Henriciella sp.]
MTPIIQIGQIGLDLIHLIAMVLALGLGAVVYRLYEQRGRDREVHTELEADFAHSQQELKTQRTLAEQARLELAELRGQTSKDKEQFGEIARGVMAQAQKQFMDLANETFSKHKAGAKGDLEKLMQPIGENFSEFKKRVEAIEKVRAEDKSAIQQQVRAIGESLHRNTAETGKLVNALTAPKGGGRWGEMTLRNVMEQAGLSAHCDFDEQVNDQTEDGRQRPDAVIHLPGGRQIVVDSKVSLEAYMAASSAEDPQQRAVQLKAHATNVQRHVTTLSSKSYQSNMDERVDFVAMFIPGENFFAAALEHAPDLLERAYSRNVIITTPSTLIGLAKTVSYVWRQEKMTENAREAAKLGEQLYDRIAVMAGHIEKLGKSLNGAVDNYNKMNSSLDKRVMPTMRKFEQLSIAPPDKAMPEPKRIEASADTSSKTGELDFAE